MERCRALDPATIPSTVYRTLDVLEELGLVRHATARTAARSTTCYLRTVHGHFHCEGCGGRWEIDAAEAASLVDGASGAPRGFQVDLSHLTVSGLCRECAASDEAATQGR